ncbi:MAG: hypothetical protein ACI4KF_08415 [Huintestinicola sp.]
MAAERFRGYRKILAISAFIVCMTACGNNAPAETELPPIQPVEAVSEETTVSDDNADTDEAVISETTETEASSETEETTEAEEAYSEQTEETTENITEAQVSEAAEPVPETDTADEAYEDISAELLLTPDDLFLKYGNNYSIEVINSAGICFDGVPFVFWVDYNWNSESVIPDGTIYAIQAVEGGSLKYNIRVGETSIDEFSALTNGKYSSDDAEIDEEMTGELMLIMKENGFTTYYSFDDNGIVTYAMVKRSD